MTTNAKDVKQNYKGVLIYPELSFQIINVAFEVYNRLGFGFSEKIYQEAFAKEFSERLIKFKRENFSRVIYKGVRVGSYFHDFVIENKVVVELKVGQGIYDNNVNQVLSYLKDTGLKLGILIVFTSKGVISKRIVH